MAAGSAPPDGKVTVLVLAAGVALIAAGLALTVTVKLAEWPQAADFGGMLRGVGLGFLIISAYRSGQRDGWRAATRAHRQNNAQRGEGRDDGQH